MFLIYFGLKYRSKNISKSHLQILDKMIIIIKSSYHEFTAKYAALKEPPPNSCYHVSPDVEELLIYNSIFSKE